MQASTARRHALAVFGHGSGGRIRASGLRAGNGAASRFGRDRSRSMGSWMVADTAQWMMEVAGLCASAQVVAGALRNTT